MEQTAKTKRFIAGVKSLLDTGIAKNYTEIVTALDWEKTMMSNVLGGRRNVPSEIYRKFTEIYQIDDRYTETFTIQRLIRLDAMCSVIISALGEIIAMEKGKTVGGITDDLERRVNLKIQEMTEKLK